MNFDYEIKLPNANQLVKEFGLEPGGRLQYVVDSEIVRYSSPYTPRDEGILEGSVASSIGSGLLEYEVNYAHYVWEGVSRNGKPLVYQKKNPLAGKEWVIRAMADHLDDVCRTAERRLRDGR